MIIGAIIVGVLILVSLILVGILSEKYGDSFDAGVFISIIISILIFIEICLFGCIIEKQKPSALDVYQDKTILEYTIRDGVKVDSVVVFKKELK